MEARLHGPLGNAELLRDLGDGELTPEAEREEPLLVGRQAAERGREVGVIRRWTGPCAGRRIEGDETRPSGAPPEFIAADVDEDPGEPAVRALAVPERSASVPGQQGRLLDGILGGRRVMKDEHRKLVRVVDPGEEQPADSIVRGHGRRGLVEHALPLRVRRGGCRHDGRTNQPNRSIFGRDPRSHRRHACAIHTEYV
jgi:hypothetical protein